MTKEKLSKVNFWILLAALPFLAIIVIAAIDAQIAAYKARVAVDEYRQQQAKEPSPIWPTRSGWKKFARSEACCSNIITMMGVQHALFQANP